MKRVVFILGVLEDEDVDWLIDAGQRRELQPGEVLIREGAACDDIFLILNGSLEVSVVAMGDQPIAQLATGEVVGEMSFVDGQPPSATVTALEPGIVLAISCSQLRHKLQQDMWFASRFYRALAILLSSRLRSTVKHLQGEHWRPVTNPNDAGLDEMGDMLSMGNIRFDWMLKRLRNVNSNPWEELEVDSAD
ncbi:cyclic nucleotide-binding domain-containing protein [Phormidium tenue]|uniref:Cyclic nucleotide-binding protein n=1 Tax=Phormidium tenue NIES-30 TaxID=549789 RepID=A0A1U7JB06_9CYAN|nr:cyclic nucleotide-binding domain-containing protein [Phormidium tenue]MBD2230304.1 cyclic nucleotide-binding domain-containing protein [Phormidium tenue FACHB-1052]OKH50892.1 cyclic nucleotide-binding protein [Phormidium tenue NIES-30]